MIHAVNFAAHYQQLKGKKLVFIVSPQWFIKKGSDEQHFAPNFSSLQALDLAFNNQIDPAVKKNMMKRMLRFKVVQHDAVLSELYKGMVNGQSWKVKAVMPAAKAYYSLLEKKDLYYSMGETKGLVDPFHSLYFLLNLFIRSVIDIERIGLGAPFS